MVFSLRMGGGTGTGSIPAAPRVAKAVGAVTIAIVTRPFSFELGRRQKELDAGLEKLRQFTDTLIVIPNDKLIEVAAICRLRWLLRWRTMCRQGVQGISELITETGLINVDFRTSKTSCKARRRGFAFDRHRYWPRPDQAGYR